MYEEKITYDWHSTHIHEQMFHNILDLYTYVLQYMNYCIINDCIDIGICLCGYLLMYLINVVEFRSDTKKHIYIIFNEYYDRAF